LSQKIAEKATQFAEFIDESASWGDPKGCCRQLTSAPMPDKQLFLIDSFCRRIDR
jgi:hypothetical protein